MTFLLVAAAGVVMAIAYRRLVSETLAPDSRSPTSLVKAGRSYGALLIDMRFLAPALTVSLIIGGLFAFFAAAPAELIDGFRVGPFGLSVFFAATVLVVFSGGLLAPRFSRRMGHTRATSRGALLAFIGSALVLACVAAGLSLIWFTLALTVFLFGMGLVNPLGTALTLQPFGNQAGLASALLGSANVMRRTRDDGKHSAVASCRRCDRDRIDDQHGARCVDLPSPDPAGMKSGLASWRRADARLSLPRGRVREQQIAKCRLPQSLQSRTRYGSCVASTAGIGTASANWQGFRPPTCPPAFRVN